MEGMRPAMTGYDTYHVGAVCTCMCSESVPWGEQGFEGYWLSFGRGLRMEHCGRGVVSDGGVQDNDTRTPKPVAV